MDNTKQTSLPKEGSFKTLSAVFKKNVPWIWLICNFIFGICMSYFYTELPDITAQIAAGEIFDSALILRFVLLSVVQALCTVLATISVKWMGYAIERNIRKGVWKKLIRMKQADYDREAPTSLISRITSDATMTTEFLTSMMEGILCLIYLVVVFLTVFSLSASIGFALLAVLPYFALIAIVPGKLKYKWAAARQDKLAGYTNYVTEKIGNIRTVKALTMTEEDISAGHEKALACFTAEKKLAIIEGVCEPFVYFSQVVINLIVILMAGRMVQSGALTTQNMFTLYLQGSNIYSFALMSVSMYYALKISHGSTKKIGKLMCAENEVFARETDMPVEGGDIVFRNVIFAYEKENILENVSFTIPRGQTTAIVGPSGSGKSSVIRLIERLYEPQSGAIEYGSQNTAEIHLDKWRRAVGVVQQTCPMLGGTIADNISYGMSGEVSEEMLIDASKKAGIYDFIAFLPQGFETEVGQMGDKLSGGQKQRLAVARLILKNPDILLLDEPTSNLDSESTALVSESLEAASAGKTTVIVAHDIRSVRNATHFIVMKKGSVEAEGTREQVYASSETFRTYCDLQKSISL